MESNRDNKSNIRDLRIAARQRQAAALEQTERLFAAHPALYVSVISYVVSHSVMKLAVHPGTYPAHTSIVCGGCSYFSGAMQGGPYRMTISRQTDGESSEGFFVIRGNGDELVIKCERLQVEEVSKAGHYVEPLPNN